MHNAQGNHGLVDIKALSVASGYSVAQLRRLARAGRIPCYQPAGKGGKLLFPPDAIQRSGQQSPAEPSASTKQQLSGPRPHWMAQSAHSTT